MELFSFLLLIPAILEFKDSKVRFSKIPLLYPLLFFIGVMWVGTLLSNSPLKEKLYDMQRARFYGIYFILFFALRGISENRILKWMRVPLIFLIIYGVCQHFWGPIDLFRPEGKKILMYAIPEQKIGPLVVGVFNHHLTFSNVILLYACLFFSEGFLQKKKWDLVLGLGAFVLCIWTESRAAWFAIPAVMGLMLFQKGKKWFFSGMAFLAIVFSLVYVSDSGFKERFDRTFISQEVFYSLNWDNPRLRLWRAQLAMFQEYPVFGVGWNNSERRSKEYIDKLFGEADSNFYGHAHSEVLQVLSSTGVLGLIAFVWIWVVVFKMCVQLWRRGKGNDSKVFYFGVFAALVGFHLQGLTQWNFGDAEVLHNIIFLWAVIAVAYYSMRHETSIETEPSSGYN